MGWPTRAARPRVVSADFCSTTEQPAADTSVAASARRASRWPTLVATGEEPPGPEVVADAQRVVRGVRRSDLDGVLGAPLLRPLEGHAMTARRHAQAGPRRRPHLAPVDVDRREGDGVDAEATRLAGRRDGLGLRLRRRPRRRRFRLRGGRRPAGAEACAKPGAGRAVGRLRRGGGDGLRADGGRPRRGPPPAPPPAPPPRPPPPPPTAPQGPG